VVKSDALSHFLSLVAFIFFCFFFFFSTDLLVHFRGFKLIESDLVTLGPHCLTLDQTTLPLFPLIVLPILGRVFG
jgi:hypothetical protein